MLDISESSNNKGMIKDLTERLTKFDEGDIGGLIEKNYWKKLENAMAAMAGDGSRFKIKMKKNKLKVTINPATQRNKIISKKVLKDVGL